MEPDVSEPTFAAQKFDGRAGAGARPTRPQRGAAIVEARGTAATGAAGTGAASAAAGRGAGGRRAARVAPRVVGVEPVAVQAVVVARHPRGHPVGQFRELGLGDDDGARVEEVLRERGVVGRHQAGEGQRPAGGRHEGGVDVVLERDRDAVQRPADLAGGALAIERVGLFQRLVVDGDDGVDRVFVHRDAREVLRDDLARGGASLLHRRLHLGNRGFHDRERGTGRFGGRRRRGRAGGRQADQGQEQGSARGHWGSVREGADYVPESSKFKVQGSKFGGQAGAPSVPFRASFLVVTCSSCTARPSCPPHLTVLPPRPWLRTPPASAPSRASCVDAAGQPVGGRPRSARSTPRSA